MSHRMSPRKDDGSPHWIVLVTIIIVVASVVSVVAGGIIGVIYWRASANARAAQAVLQRQRGAGVRGGYLPL